MTTLVERELMRARWSRALDRHGVDRTDREDFAGRGLAKRLRTPSVQILLLPADPDSELVDVDDGLWAWLENQKTVSIEGRPIRFGNQKIPTAHSAALVDSYGSHEPWTSYLAVHRSGAIEYGLGDRGGWERKNRDDEVVRVFNLISIVARTWALLKFGTAFLDRTSLPAPYQLTVALQRTRGALLGNVGEGWAEPMSHENNVGGCADEHLLWHLELETWPDEGEQRVIASKIGDRVEDAWGVVQRRYLAHRGDRIGRLDVRQVPE